MTQFYLKFGFGAVPQNVILDHTMQVRYSINGFNSQQVVTLINQLISELPTVDTDPHFKPDEIKLNFQAYPNPFNSSTMLEFNLPESGSTSLTIYDINGRQVAEIYRNILLTKGNHKFRWNTSGLPSGLYFIHFKTTTKSTTLKVQLLK
ncbi:MAG: T9SS type A sorting domain-containing protein [Candidatus Marinimicrobia bacterium]|nr:T9SS type A sorting domain-containing protein [Candidatus Neomarinimicrobiota bacterium]